MTRRAGLWLIAVPLALCLVAGGAAAQLLSFPEWYQLPRAAANNKLDDIRTMLGRGDNPNTTDEDGRTALSYAAANGNVDMAKLLIDERARMDYRDKFGNIPLHWAAENGRVEMVRLLVAAKSPVDPVNKQGITPLMLAAGRGKIDAVRILLDAGADPRKQDFTGRDAIGWAGSYAATMRVLSEAKPK